MDRYYYLVSQLPFLKFAEENRFSHKRFLEEAKKWLSLRAFDILSRVSIDNFYCDKRDPAILKNYKDFELELRRELVSLRKAYKNKEEYKPEGVLKSVDYSGNPLDLETKLLFLRWQFVEDLEEGHFFDLEILILYCLKLQISNRLFTFDKTKGIEKFDQLCEVKV